MADIFFNHASKRRDVMTGAAAMALGTASRAKAVAASGFIGVKGTQLVLDGAPFFVTGVNNHYLSWGSEAEVRRVLDDAVAMGANVVRTFLGAVIGSPDGKTRPTVWKFHNDQVDSDNLNVHGNYVLYWDPAQDGMAVNMAGVRKIDFLIAEAAKRRLKLILAFLDYWPFAGGAEQMRAWYGGYDRRTFFFADPHTVRDTKTWMKFLIERLNPLTGIVYRDDPIILAWELMNEPQAPLLLRNSWISAMSAFVKSLDSNHLVSTGEDRLNNADFTVSSIDFVTWHGYPIYYGISADKFTNVITKNSELARRYGKPVLLEEFGYAQSNRDPDQAQAYQKWLDTMHGDPDCAGWVVWRLVSRQDDGRYPADPTDLFDIRNDNSETWRVLSRAAHQGRSG